MAWVVASNSKIVIYIYKAVVLLSLIQTQLSPSESQTSDQRQRAWIRSGYWLTVSEFPIPELDSSLFTHLFCAFAGINSTTFQISIPSSEQQYFASFTSTVQLKNPSILTLLSIGDYHISSAFFSMINTSSSRHSFILSSIQTATRYGFHGLDLCCFQPNTTSDSTNMAALFHEWRLALNSHSHSSNKLILTMGLLSNPTPKSDDTNVTYPVDSISTNFDWVHLMSFDYFVPIRDKLANPPAALYDPYYPHRNADYQIREWINTGLSPDRITIGLPYHGWAWTLLDPNPKDNQIGAPASGPGITQDGSFSYSYLKGYVRGYKAEIVYNSTYVQNYCSFGSFWVGFDDVEAITNKVSYAKEKGLGGYTAFQLSNDDNWLLSRAAAQIKRDNQHNKRQLLIKVLVPVTLISCLTMSTILFFLRTKLFCSTGTRNVDATNFGSDAPDLKVFKFMDISEATKNFSFYNKLGQGGYGPVYKGKLKNGQEIAVKRLSKTSSQGFEEFKNEVMLTARLQHVNLVKVMGFCMEREEKMLIYEYLPNKSLDFYLFDPLKRLQLDWEKRVRIIEGIIQGLLYLQEYSRLTIIHRDLKTSNILLDKDLNPKISDFGLARIFQKDGDEANTSRIVGTYRYVPPEYVKQGIYSTKYDVYSFGVLLLQIISGKSTNCLYGLHEDLSLLEYAYELWMEGQGMEFIDPALKDENSSGNDEVVMIRCLQVALLCVQEKQEDRPSMLEVWSMLKNGVEPTPNLIPKRPAFSVRGRVAATKHHTSCSASSSCPQTTSSYGNSITTEVLEPR